MGVSAINENREGKNINLARKMCVSRGYSQENAQQIVDAVRHDIPNSRLFQCKFLTGVTRMYLDRELQDGNFIMKLNQCLKFLKAHVDEYDWNLNGLSAQEVVDRFSTVARQDLESDMERSNSAQHMADESYQIVRIDDEYEAEPYGQYTDWCVTDPDSDAYNSYTGGLGVFYFCLKDGFEDIPMEEGPGCPLDEYGLSMIAVSVNEDGSCNTITCRWNHDNGGNDHIMTVEQLEQVIGRGFYQTFKPRTPEEIQARRMRILDEIAYEAGEEASWNGVEDNEYAFGPLYDEDDENAYKVFRYRLNDYAIIVDENADPVVGDFFDEVWMSNAGIMVEKNGRMNIVANMSDHMRDFQYVLDEWYPKIIASNVSGYLIVMDGNNLFNVFSVATRSFLFGDWLKAVSVFRGNTYRGLGPYVFAIALLDDGYNIFIIKGSTVGKPIFRKSRSEIKMGPSGIFIEVSPESGGPLVNGRPMELYALNFEKFPYTATSLEGWVSMFGENTYKIVCQDRVAYIDDDTSNGWKIIKEYTKSQLSGSAGENQIAEGMKAKRSVAITEGMADRIKDILYPTKFKFTAALKRFLASLLEDPCGAEPGVFFTGNGITRDSLLKSLKDFKIIRRKLGIDDRDSEGRPHTARMTVRYTVPKARFQDRADALFAELFENRAVNECGAAGGGGATSCGGVDGNGFGSGEFVQPLFGGMTVRKQGPYTKNRKKRKKIDESNARDTDTSSAVYVYTMDANGRWCILCARRSQNCDEGGKWNPPMGHRQEGESFWQCAVRECMEESGLDISALEPFMEGGRRFTWGSEFVIIVPQRAGTKRIAINGQNDGENGRFEWMPVADINPSEWAWSCGRHAEINCAHFAAKADQ